MNITPEQQAVCDSDASVMKVKAGAGTGKTTTLQGLAARHPRDRVLYLAFNKAIKEEAQARFPSNVRAMTAHGLAFSKIGRYYADQGQLAQGDIKPFQVLPFLTASVSQIPKGLRPDPEDPANILISGARTPLRVRLVSTPAEDALLSPRNAPTD